MLSEPRRPRLFFVLFCFLTLRIHLHNKDERRESGGAGITCIHRAHSKRERERKKRIHFWTTSSSEAGEQQKKKEHVSISQGALKSSPPSKWTPHLRDVILLCKEQENGSFPMSSFKRTVLKLKYSVFCLYRHFALMSEFSLGKIKKRKRRS